jgi:micrococcal nuclease
MYEYSARLIRVVDGDTVDLDVDLGFDIRISERIRLAGVNCPEHGTLSGDNATAYTAQWLAQNGPDFVLRTIKDKKEKFGRLLGTITAGERTLNVDLLTDGFAIPYDGGKRLLPAQPGEADPAQPVL